MRAVSTQETTQRLGRYELLSELGQGAMGVVYKARDPVLDRIVAVKTINLTLPKDELSEYEARFYQEARAAGGLNHPNIVTIYDIGRSERVAYMAMEFLEGEELRSILASREPLPVELALDIAAQVADGLAYAHDRHIIHRDIKPANIMVVHDGLVKITDFGIARMRTNEVKTMTGMILGSPKYMSPEQVAGKRADYRSDLFSLGVVLYEMLTGEAPFQADSIHGIMYKIMQTTPPPPSVKNPQLPEVLDLILAKALNKAPEDRYQDAREFGRDLRECRDTLLGRLSGPARVASGTRGQPLPAPATRRSDKVAAVKPSATDTPPEQEAKGLTLSKAFDSYEATLKLAALTGAEKDLQTFAEAQSPQRATSAAAASAAASATSTWQEVKAPAARRAPQRASAHSHTYLWIIGAVAIAIALALLLLR
jgi:serine/threonine-protein kinase